MLTAALLLVFLQAPPTAPPAQSSDLPSPQDTLAYLNQTIDWYRQLAVEEKIATETADVRFLNDDRQTAKQILQLAFEFARAEAKLLAAVKAVPAATADTADPSQAQAQALAQASAKSDAELRASQTELEGLKQKLQTAQGKARIEVQSTIDELQSEINLGQTRAETFHSILEFVGQGGSSASLTAQIDELQKSIPELAADASKTPGAQNTTLPAPTVVQASRLQPAGILDLVTNLFTLRSKVRTLDEAIDATNTLGTASGKFRVPLVGKLRIAAQRGEELAKAADTSNAAQLDQEKRALDALTANFKQISTVVVPLGKQTILFDSYKRNLTRWRDTAQSEYSDNLRDLIVKATALSLALAVVFTLAEIWRKATFRYIQDVRRRHQFLLIRRIVLWCAVGITIAFGLATEIGSLATFAGLITAGIAVALQNVILAVAGYFFLVGKYGVRIGDRVQISGVTGNVVDIGMLRLHLMELGGPGTDAQPTGRVVVFSNSIVFQPTGSLFKQIPGTNFGWHEVKLILAPDSDYSLAEKRMLAAVESVYEKYREKIVQQHRKIEHAYSLGVNPPEPISRLHLAQTGLEVAIRYPLELENSAEIDDQITRALLDALEKPPRLKLVGSGTPNIQPVIEKAPAG